MSEHVPEDQVASEAPFVWTQWLTNLKDVTGPAALAVGILYLLGILVVNSYLFQWGFWEFGLVKPRYVGAGLLFSAHYTASFVVVLFAWQILGSPFKLTPPAGRLPRRLAQWLKSSAQLIVRVFLFGAVVLLFSILFHLLFTGCHPDVPSLAFTGCRIDVIDASARWGSSLFGAFVLLRMVGNPEREMTRPNLVLTLFAAILLSGVYGRTFYPLIPPTLAGGGTTTVRFVVLQSNQDVLAQLVPLEPHLPQAPLSAKSIPVELLDRTDDSYLVLRPDRRAVEIRKEIVSGVVYAREEGEAVDGPTP